VASLVLGAGYLGAALIECLCAAGGSVVAVDNGFSADWSALAQQRRRWGQQLTLIHGDVRDRDALRQAFTRAEPVQTVYLLAAQASAHAAAATPEFTEEVNLRAPRLVLEEALKHGKPPVVYGSSFHVYGAPLEGTLDETSPYGAFHDLSHLSKVYAEKLGELYAGGHGVPFSPVRLGIVYGIGPIMKKDLRFVTVPHAFCLRLLRGETLRVDPSGLRSMGFIHISDAVSALIAAPADGYAPANAVGEVATVVDVARAVEAAARRRGLGAAIEVPPSSADPAPPRFTVSSRLHAAGWQPAWTLEQTVGDVLDHYASFGAAQ
jgi:nucleoside-diphosphate-sugar epimerase